MAALDGLIRGWSRQDGEAGKDWLIRLERVDRASLTFDGKLHLDAMKVEARQAAVEEQETVEAGRKKERAGVAAAALAEKIRQFEDTCAPAAPAPSALDQAKTAYLNLSPADRHQFVLWLTGGSQ
jgi:hypothetical protein